MKSLLSSNEVGFHRGAISSTIGGFIPYDRTDLVEKSTCFRKCFFLAEKERLPSCGAQNRRALVPSLPILTAAPSQTPSPRPRRRSFSMPAPFVARVRVLSLYKKKHRHPIECLCFWRRRRDSNSRAGV